MRTDKSRFRPLSHTPEAQQNEKSSHFSQSHLTCVWFAALLFAWTLKWDNGLLGGKPQSSGRYPFTTARDYDVRSPLQESGLLGPVTLRVVASLQTHGRAEGP